MESIFDFASQDEDSPLAEWLGVVSELLEITIDWDATIT